MTLILVKYFERLTENDNERTKRSKDAIQFREITNNASRFESIISCEGEFSSPIIGSIFYERGNLIVQKRKNERTVPVR